MTGWVCPEGFAVRSTEKGALSRKRAGRINDAIRSFVVCFDESFSWIEQRFYLLDDMQETDFAKASKYGLWRGWDFDLSTWLTEGRCPREEAARALWGKNGSSHREVPARREAAAVIGRGAARTSLPDKENAGSTPGAEAERRLDPAV